MASSLPSAAASAVSIYLLTYFPGQVQINFQPLVDDLEAMLQEVKEVVIDHILGSVNDAVRDAGVDTTVSVSILKESFATSDVLSTMDERFHKFFSARQTAVSLKNDQPAAYFKKLAVQMRVKALNAKVLSRHGQVVNVSGVSTLIKNNLEATRTEWKRLVEEQVVNFVGQQFSMLYNDLTWGTKGLLKGLLCAFLQHIVQTSRMQGDTKLQHELRRFLSELKQQTNQAHALWTRLIKRDDAEELGRAAAQQVEGRRHRQMIQRLAGRFSLGRPAMRMVPLQLKRDDTPICFKYPEIFLEGDLDLVPTLNQHVLSRYKRGVCKTGRSDLFSAFAMVVWGKRGIKERLGENFLDGLTSAAKQLRAICSSQLRHFLRNEARAAEIETFLCEPVAQYLSRLESSEYNGDALCLFFLADHFKQYFLLWRPGTASHSPIFFHRNGVPKEAHHLVLAAEKPTTDAPAASYNPTWFFFVDERRVNIVELDPTHIHEIGLTDDEAKSIRKANKEAQHKPATDHEVVDVVRKRPNADGTFTTMVNGETMVNSHLPLLVHGKRPRTGGA